MGASIAEGSVRGLNLRTTSPRRFTRNLVKFHLIARESRVPLCDRLRC